MPQLGESIAEATIVRIAVQIGDQVAEDQEIIEVETNKAVMGVTTPCPGRLTRLLVELQQSYAVGATLGYLEASVEEAEKLGVDLNPPNPVSGEKATPAAETKASSAVEPTVRGLPVPVHSKGASYMSPRMKARMNELGLRAVDLAGIAGSGAAGRVTVEDLEKFLAALEKKRDEPGVAHAGGRRRRDAKKLDKTPGDRRPPADPGADAGSQACLESEARPGSVRFARVGDRAVGKSRSSRTTHRGACGASGFHRCRIRRGG